MGIDMTLTADALANALLKGGQAAALLNFELSGDPDVPIHPESLVQVAVAQALRDELQLASVELEVDTERLVQAASGRGLSDPSFPQDIREGRVDIVGWSTLLPQVFVEVKDQISGTDDGIVADILRVQELMSIPHKLGLNSKLPRFGAVLYFVGKNSREYRKGRHLASQFIPYADRTVATSLKNVQRVIDISRFRLLVKKLRVLDSAADGPPDPLLVNTEFEETVSGREQFTYCVVCVLQDMQTGSSANGLTSPPQPSPP